MTDTHIDTQSVRSFFCGKKDQYGEILMTKKRISKKLAVPNEFLAKKSYQTIKFEISRRLNPTKTRSTPMLLLS